MPTNMDWSEYQYTLPNGTRIWTHRGQITICGAFRNNKRCRKHATYTGHSITGSVVGFCNQHVPTKVD